MSAITDAYADYEANKGFYESESRTFSSGRRTQPAPKVEKISRFNAVDNNTHRVGLGVRPADLKREGGLRDDRTKGRRHV